MDMPSPPTETEVDVIVAGAGPVGLAATLGLAQQGFAVMLVGPDMTARDLRTTALMTPALDYLQSLGIDIAFGGEAEPLETMRIIDGTRRLIRSPTVTFRASEIDLEAFGANIPNRILNESLSRALGQELSAVWRQESVVSWELTEEAAVATLADGRVRAKLVVAADGRNSMAREAAQIRTIGHSYPQSALVLTFEHTRPHANISTEFHTETGPFTQVPLPGQNSSLVWVLDPQEADRLMVMDDDQLSSLVEARMESMLGRVTVRSGRQIYPLSARMPVRFAANRVALVGEAAHAVPPIGAQGLNLGLRDVKAVVDMAVQHRDDPGGDVALEAYDRQRRPDILARNAAVNLLNRSLLSDFLPVQATRSAGLALLGGFSPLRQFFMREGMAPGSGWRAMSSRKEIGRH